MEEVIMYNKILVAKHSPQNKCYAEDEEWLVILDRMRKGMIDLPDDTHYFVGVHSRKPSRYGWVKTIDYKIVPQELAKMYNYNPSEELIQICELILKAAYDQKDGTPMAARIITVGLLEKERRKLLKVHKVFFYKA